MSADPLRRFSDPELKRFQVVERVADGRRYWYGGPKGLRVRSGHCRYEAWNINGKTDELVFDSDDLAEGRIIIIEDEVFHPD